MTLFAPVKRTTLTLLMGIIMPFLVGCVSTGSPTQDARNFQTVADGVSQLTGSKYYYQAQVANSQLGFMQALMMRGGMGGGGGNNCCGCNNTAVAAPVHIDLSGIATARAQMLAHRQALMQAQSMINSALMESNCTGMGSGMMGAAPGYAGYPGYAPGYGYGANGQPQSIGNNVRNLATNTGLNALRGGIVGALSGGASGAASTPIAPRY